VPQLNGMYNGDRSRKETLVQYGFPTALCAGQQASQIRGIRSKRVKRVIYVSATPGPYELEKAELVAEQIIRPQGWQTRRSLCGLQPTRWTTCWAEIKGVVPVATDNGFLSHHPCTKSMAEDLTDYYADLGP